MKAEIERCVFMGLVALFAVAALYVAARAGHGAPYWGGLGFSTFCVGILFYAISKGSRAAH
jgi:hypothetical protein